MICFRLNNFTFIIIFSITHSGFTPKIIPHTLDNVFITRPHIFLLEIHLKLVMEFLVLRFLIGWWLAGRWLLYLVAGWLVGGRWSVGRLVGCRWKVGGWSVVLRKPINWVIITVKHKKQVKRQIYLVCYQKLWVHQC